jgi:hypothetical protein
VPIAKPWKARIVRLSFAPAIGDEAAGWLVRFVAPAFAYVKIAAFLTLQTTLAVMVIAVAWALATAQPNAYRDEDVDADVDEDE